MIEVGDYVKTNNGLLGKVNKIELKGSGIRYAGEFITDTIIQFNDGKVYERRVRNKDIVKHSKIISEVVEVGDYVNGKRIHKIDKGQNYCYLYYGNCKTFVDYQIKTILTKEQYIQNCYTVEREEEC